MKSLLRSSILALICCGYHRCNNAYLKPNSRFRHFRAAAADQEHLHQIEITRKLRGFQSILLQ